jgi:hypothetical protein
MGFSDPLPILNVRNVFELCADCISQISFIITLIARSNLADDQLAPVRGGRGYGVTAAKQLVKAIGGSVKIRDLPADGPASVDDV